MLRASEFDTYVQELNLDQPAVALLKSIRCGVDGRPAPPVRRMESRVGNVTVRYPSNKMGFVVECESGRAEFYAALNWEHDADVFEYYSQPVTLALRYKSARGKSLTVHHTPDFLVLRSGAVEFVECKTVDGLARQVETQPNRYRMGEDGRWSSPPAEEAAKHHGLGYRIWTPAELTSQFIANLRYLDPHYRRNANAYSPDYYLPIVNYVREHQGIFLDELAEHFGTEAPALIRWMIVQRHLFGDLQHRLISESSDFPLYTSSDLIPAAKHFCPNNNRRPSSLSDNSTSVTKTSNLITEAYQHFGAAAFAVANRRFEILNSASKPMGISARTIRSWRQRYARAEKLSQVGFLGLLPRTAAQGNRTPRYSDDIIALADTIIRDYYLVTAGMRRAAAYRVFISRCVRLQLGTVPSQQWFYIRAAAVMNRTQTTLARQGPRAAYPLLPGLRGQVGALDVHGDYPLQVVHIDHTQLDIEIVSSTGLNLGRPWLTIAFDAATRAVLGIYLSFDAPSVNGVLMVLRDVVLRHRLLPIGLTVDNGPEFHSVWFETFTAIYKILVSRRPPRHARFGSVIENFFGVSNSQLIHTLVGNTQLARNIRQITKSVNPARKAIWTLPALYQVLETFCLEHYNQRPHPEVGHAPAEVFDRLVVKHGVQSARAQNFDEAFLISTMVNVDGNTARVQPARGVKVRGDYFYHPDLDQVLGEDVNVRYDPMDPGRVFAEVGGKWVACLSKYADRVAGLTVRQVECWSQELRRRHAGVRSASGASMLRLGRFIDEIKTCTEGELHAEYERALANREVLALRPALLPSGTPLRPIIAAGTSATPVEPSVLFRPVPLAPFEATVLPKDA